VSATLSPTAIFFDFDGVLAESVALKEDAFRALFAPFGEEVGVGAVAINREMGAVSRVLKIDRIHRELLDNKLPPDELADWAARFEALVEAAVVGCDEVPGAAALLDGLAGRVRMFVISGTPEDEMRRIVEARGWSRFFVSVHGSPRLKPEIVSGLLAEHGLAPDECLFVGDTFTDRDAALANGVPFVGRRPVVRENPFPAGTLMVDDMTGLGRLMDIGGRP
jgi:HAD superfamily hydrolase (TIGR01549 family)